MSKEVSQQRVEGHRLAERGQRALEMGLASNIKLIVGDKKEELLACKVLLAIASPVFEAMFSGNWSEEEIVEVPDIEPEVFRKLLQFIYTHRVDIDYYEEALELLTAANKYMLPDLVDKCVISLVTTLKECSMKQLCDILNYAMIYSKSLKGAALKIVQEKTEELVDSVDFLTLRADSLSCIMQQGHLNVDSEMKLIDGAVKWATARCKEKGDSIGGEEVRSVLLKANVLQQLRFLTLSEELIETRLYSLEILSNEEIESIMDSKFSHNWISPSPLLCPLNEQRIAQTQGEAYPVRQASSVVTYRASQTITETFELLVDSKHLTGITLAVQVPNEGGLYEENLRVKVTKVDVSDGNSTCTRCRKQQPGRVNNCNSCGSACSFNSNVNNLVDYAVGCFKGTVKNNDTIKIPLFLRSDTNDSGYLRKGDQLKISITFQIPGHYPVYGSGNSYKFKCLEGKGTITMIFASKI